MAKICFIASSLFTMGGEQRVTAVIANELVKNNQIIAYTMDEEPDKQNNPYQVDPRIEIRKIRQPEFPLAGRIVRRMIREVNERTRLLYNRESCYNLLEYAYFCKAWQKQMIQELSGDHYDVMIAVSGGNTIRLGLIADKLDCDKTVGWEHNAYEAYFETKGLYFWHMDQLFGRSIRKLDRCVVLNNYISQKYQEAFGRKCEVIYNPRSFVSENKSSLKNKKFVACGRCIRQKGFDLLLESFHLFAEKESEWTLTIVGDGDMRSQLEEQIERYHLKDRVTITGYTKEVKKYLLDASVYLLSSRWEGFPMVLTEAFEMGLPVVSYNITAIEPLITEGREGYLAESYDVRKFADRMLEMTELSQKDRQRMAAYAIEKADSLAVERIIEQWKDLLKAD